MPIRPGFSDAVKAKAILREEPQACGHAESVGNTGYNAFGKLSDVEGLNNTLPDSMNPEQILSEGLLLVLKILNGRGVSVKRHVGANPVIYFYD
jgi:hypothetical protein